MVKVLAPFDSETGILVVGHGSREPEGNHPVLQLCRLVEERLAATPVQPCYLELAEPTIDDGLAALSRRGVTRVVVVSLQLAAGRHVRYDIPCQVGRSLTKMSNMFVCYARHLGEHPGLPEIADSRLREALHGRHSLHGATEHILVARGSRDPLVRGEILQWAANRSREERGWKPCFLAMTSPLIGGSLKEAIARKPARILVQPHLLFPGRLHRQIRAHVAELARRHPHIDWVCTLTLGPDSRLADCVVDLAIEATEGLFSREVV